MKNNSTILFLLSIFLAGFSFSGAKLALAWYTLKTFGAPALGISVFAVSVAQFFGSLIAGYFTDRYKKQLVAVITNILCAITILAVAISVKIQLPLYLIIALSSFSSFALAIHDNATKTIIPQLSSTWSLQTINGYYISLFSVGLFLAPVIAGWWMDNAPAWHILIGMSILSLIASLLIFVINIAEKSTKQQSIAKPQLVVFAENQWLYFGIFSATLANFFIIPFSALLIPSYFAATGFSAKEFGYFSAALALGFIAAGFVLKKNNDTIPLSRLTIYLSSAAVIFGITFLINNLLFILSCCFLSGLLLAHFEITWNAILQKHSPPATLGKIYSVNSWLSFAGRSAGILFAELLLRLFTLNNTALWLVIGALSSLTLLHIVAKKRGMLTPR